MNAMACVTLEDFIKPYSNFVPKTYTIISKCLVLIFGVTFILFAYIASQWGGLIQVIMGHLTNVLEVVFLMKV